jgi:surface antigen
MKRRSLIFWGLTASTALALANPSWAMAAGNYESCVAPTAARYSCVNFTGYNGYDAYGFYLHGTKATDGTWHNCLSYAAYRLSYSNAYLPGLRTFGDAKFWATQAVSVLGATLNATPQIGDIAWWDATPSNQYGHVAVVDSIVLNTSGSINYVKVSDDNALRQVSTVKTLYPGTSGGSVSYPGTFIRFPGYITNSFGGSGGKPVYPLGAANGLLSLNDQ